MLRLFDTSTFVRYESHVTPQVPCTLDVSSVPGFPPFRRGIVSIRVYSDPTQHKCTIPTPRRSPPQMGDACISATSLSSCVSGSLGGAVCPTVNHHRSIFMCQEHINSCHMRVLDLSNSPAPQHGLHAVRSPLRGTAGPAYGVCAPWGGIPCSRYRHCLEASGSQCACSPQTSATAIESSM